ncbi:hypothetical protein [Azohydromonas caseinilytica]|uniref:UrcA family protein n=1 Tax=Azohydromonas caseinilytica TaxID=2728836 RepID=A0A848FFH7_9BURK|nr:hypothetical protein [Azohydromonas caseinilytica]NML17013.1 hypothetical protein [Azohydromonas caseinilytica]
MKARLFLIVAAALFAASAGAHAYGVNTVDDYPVPKYAREMAAGAPSAPHELTGAAAVDAYNRTVVLYATTVQMAIDVYRMCMEHHLLLARSGKQSDLPCTVPSVPVLPPMQWREGSPERKAK